MNSFSRFIQKYHKIVILFVVLLTAVSAYWATKVGMTTDIQDFFPADHPQMITYEEIEDEFGGAQYIMVALNTDNVFTRNTLTRIAELTAELEQVEGVNDVRSLTNIDEVKGTDWGVEVSALIEEIPQDDEALAELRERVLADDMYAGSIVSHDGSAALMMIEVDPEADSVTVGARVQAVVDQAQGLGELYATGTPVLNGVLVDSMKADLQKLFPIVLLLIAGILFLYFRTGWGVILPFVTVLISVVWTLGLMGYLGKQLSPISSVMPVILVSLGTAYGIYVQTRFYEELKAGKDRPGAVKQTLTSVGVAVLMAGTTTVAGFASNITSQITLMRDFGIFTAFGVLVALVISLTFVPALLLLLPPVKRRSAEGTGQSHLDIALGKVAEFVLNRQRTTMLITLTLVILAVLAIPTISTDSNFFNFFDDDTRPKIAYNLVKEKFSGSESIEIVVKGDIQEPETLRAMKALQTDLEQTGLVGKPNSVVNVLERTNMALNEGDSAFERLPDSRELVAQYFLLLEMSDDGFLSRFMTMDYGTARIQALVKDSSPEGIDKLLASVDRSIDRHFTKLDGVEVTTTGFVVLMDTLSDMLITGQVASLIISLVAVFFIVRLLLSSWEGSLLSILLIILAVLANFGLMGWAGISLDIVTALISSIGVGVGIDYAIHIYSRYQQERAQGRSTEEALTLSITTTGKAIAANAGSVIIGFMVLLFSSFPPLRYFGSLVTIIMLVSSVGAMTILPTLVLAWSRVREPKTIIEEVQVR